jgi:hypothetical protein
VLFRNFESHLFTCLLLYRYKFVYLSFVYLLFPNFESHLFTFLNLYGRNKMINQL